MNILVLTGAGYASKQKEIRDLAYLLSQINGDNKFKITNMYMSHILNEYGIAHESASTKNHFALIRQADAIVFCGVDHDSTRRRYLDYIISTKPIIYMNC